MTITRFSRSNWLHQVSNRAVRQAINSLSPHWSTGYEISTPSGTSNGLNGTNRVYNSTTLVAEPNLFVDVAGNAVYQITAFLPLALTAANNIKLDFGAGTASIVAGTMGGYANLFLANGTFVSTPLTLLNTAVNGGTLNQWIMCEVKFVCQVANSGTIQLEFAQVVAATNGTDILPGSSLIATPLDHVSES